MSASLVGSEMCIRDRCRAGLGASTAYVAECPICRARAPPLVRMKCRRSVSYTHLTLPTICSV
eukprot:6595715-Alexandrium_andersonii.AAC.1